jgi:SPP1 gp7 family putative phage head morphogenesis protein
VALRSIPVDPQGFFHGWGDPRSPRPWGGRTRPSPSEIRQAQRAQARAAQRNERPFQRGIQIEREFARSLRGFAKQITRIVEAFAPEDITEASGAAHQIAAAIQRYTEGSEDWMVAVTRRMLNASLKRDARQWQAYSEEIGAGLEHELASAPMAEAMARMEAEQVELIKSIGEEAIRRLHLDVLEGLAAGERVERAQIEAIKAELLPHVTEEYQRLRERWPGLSEDLDGFLQRRALLIARTEAARAASVLVQTRAEYIGSETYRWKTAGDWKVRPSHKRLNNKVFRWDDPPMSDPPLHSHPGQIFNCRCVAIPIF